MSYNIKAIRNLKKSKAEIQFQDDQRRKEKMNRTYEYFCCEVDPIIGECVTYLLCDQPENVLLAMLTYFDNKRNNLNLQKLNAPTKTSKLQKLYLATKISPLLSKLINRIARAKPKNVLEFLCTEVQNLLEEEHLALGLLQESDANNLKAENYVKVSNISLTTSEINIVSLGGPSTGKTSFLNALQGDILTKVKPTVGFRPLTLMYAENVKIKFYDLGGGVKIRGIWNQYYHDVHGVIYLIDSTLREEALTNSVSLLQETLSNPFLYGKPILVVANKQDLPDAIDINELRNIYSINKIPNCNFISVSCLNISPVESESIKIDPAIECGVENFISVIHQSFQELNDRVLHDTFVKEETESKLRAEKEKKILRNKIAAAFPNMVQNMEMINFELPSLPEDCFTSEEGLQFLASEIGDEVSNLPNIAQNIARLVNYQKLVLQMIGALKSPISKKKIPLSWEDILKLVNTLREDLGIVD